MRSPGADAPSQPSPTEEPAGPAEPTRPAAISGRPRRGCLRRLGCSVLIVGALLAAGLAAAGWWAIETTDGRRAVLDRVTAFVADRAGWAIEVADFDLTWDLDGGQLTLDEIVAGAPGAEPFTTVQQAAIDFRWQELMAQPLVLRRVRAIAPIVDLRAPLPPSDGATDEPSADLPLEIQSIELIDAHLRGQDVAQGWLDTWSVQQARIDASLIDGRIDLDLANAALTLERTEGRTPFEAVGGGTIRGPVRGPYEISDLAFTGDGLDLEARGTAGVGPDQPLDGRFRLEARPGTVLGELPADAGELMIEGDVDLRAAQGDLEVRLRSVPPELFEPALGAERLDLLGARGTHLDGAARIVLGGRTDAGDLTESASGTADLVWRRATEPLLRAEVRTLDGPPDALQLAFDARLLPDAPGTRRAQGRLRADGWEQLARATLFDTVVAIETADLTAAVDDLRRRWPSLLPDDEDLPGGGAGLRGALEARAELQGALDAPGGRLEATWRPRPEAAPGAVARLAGEGSPLQASGRFDLELELFDLDVLGLGVGGRLEGTTRVVGSPTELDLAADLRATDLGALGAAAPWLRTAELRVATDGRTVAIEELRGELLLPPAGQDRRQTGEEASHTVPIHARGELLVDLDEASAIRSADLHLDARRPLPNVERIGARALLDDGVLRLELLDFDSAGSLPRLASFDAVVPLGALAKLPGGEAIEALPVARADGAIDLTLEVPRFDSAQLVQLADLDPPPPQRLTTSLEAAFTFDPMDPTAARGQVELREAVIELADTSVRAEQPLQLVLENRRLEMPLAVFSIGDELIEIEGEAQLTPGWTLDEPFAQLLRSFDLHGDGALSLSLLTPYLAGGIGEGLATVELNASGTPTALDGRLTVASEAGSITYLEPYATRLSAPQLELTLADGALRLERGIVRLNEGELDVEGTIDLTDRTRLDGFFDRVRYRLDYGLTVLLSGNFVFTLPADDALSLQANVLVERGFLRRNIDTDRELLERFLAPPELDELSDAGPFARSLELDIDIGTVEGVVVKNNVADLKATWARIAVEGTLAQPRIDGTVTVDPGGRLYVYGQVVRIDDGAVEFSGDPRVGPNLDFQTTSSLEDPSIATPEDQQILAQLSQRNRDEIGGQSDEERARQTRE
ncbi:MAG: translocation/assembly module TamB domain-containing protein, partial [Acidobacteriota bacterium]